MPGTVSEVGLAYFVIFLSKARLPCFHRYNGDIIGSE